MRILLPELRVAAMAGHKSGGGNVNAMGRLYLPSGKYHTSAKDTTHRNPLIHTIHGVVQSAVFQLALCSHAIVQKTIKHITLTKRTRRQIKGNTRYISNPSDMYRILEVSGSKIPANSTDQIRIQQVGVGGPWSYLEGV